jgi:hypothetical protein
VQYGHDIKSLTEEITWVCEFRTWISQSMEVSFHFLSLTVVNRVTLRKDHHLVEQLEYIGPEK